MATSGSDATHSSAIYSGESICDNARNELGEALAIRPITNLSIIVVGLNEEADTEGLKVGNGVASIWVLSGDGASVGEFIGAFFVGEFVGGTVVTWILSGDGTGVGGFMGALGEFVGTLGEGFSGTSAGLGVSSLGVLASVPGDGAKV